MTRAVDPNVGKREIAALLHSNGVSGRAPEERGLRVRGDLQQCGYACTGVNHRGGGGTGGERGNCNREVAAKEIRCREA
jgi:hypothetical protein